MTQALPKAMAHPPGPAADPSHKLAADPSHKLVDSHCHIVFRNFEADLYAVAQRWRDAGVVRL
ncbi:MAG: deoxyribonuclease, partial [Synechococcus sp. ELA619]